MQKGISILQATTQRWTNFTLAKREGGSNSVWILQSTPNEHGMLCIESWAEWECTYYKPKMQNYWYFAWTIAQFTASSTQFHAISEGILEGGKCTKCQIYPNLQNVRKSIRAHERRRGAYVCKIISNICFTWMQSCIEFEKVKKTRKDEAEGREILTQSKLQADNLKYSSKLRAYIVVVFVYEKQLLHCNQANSKINTHTMFELIINDAAWCCCTPNPEYDWFAGIGWKWNTCFYSSSVNTYKRICILNYHISYVYAEIGYFEVGIPSVYLFIVEYTYMPGIRCAIHLNKQN